MTIYKLKDKDIQALGPRPKKQSSDLATEYSVSDGGGLYLVVRLGAGNKVDKYWSFLYTSPLLRGRRRKMGLGKYPTLSLANARRMATAYREKVALRLDPIDEKEEEQRIRAEAAARRDNTFRKVADDWFEWFKMQWNDDTASAKRGQLNNHILPHLGNKPMHLIEERDVALVVRKVAEKSRSVAPRVRKIIKLVFQHACDHALLEREANFMRDADHIGGRIDDERESFPAIIEPAMFRELLLDIDLYKGRGLVVSSCMRLLPLLAQRPGQVIKMRWSDLRLRSGEWHVKGVDRKGKNDKKKKKKPVFIVPLPTQAVEILRELETFTGGKEWVFLGERQGRHISLETPNRALQTMGWPTSGDDQRTHCSHGFRTSFLTIAQNVFGSEVAVAADRHLGHEPKIEDAASNLGDVYNRAMLTDERRVLVQRWADYLDQLKKDGPSNTTSRNSNVVQLSAMVA